MFAQADVSTKLPSFASDLRLVSSTNTTSHNHLDLYPNLTVAMAQRVTLRKRQPYNTSSSRRRIVKTPGGILRYHHIKKLPTAPKCGDCGMKLSGVRTSLLTLLFMRSAAYRII